MPDRLTSLTQAPRPARSAVVDRLIGALLCSMALLGTPVAHAHDQWIVATSRPMPENFEISLDLLVGEALREAETKGFSLDNTTRFSIHSGSQQTDLRELLGQEVRHDLKLRVPGPGTALVALDRDYTRIELPSNKFNDYLATEGLADVIEARTVAGESDKPGRERYRRFLKALVQLDDPRVNAGQTERNLAADSSFSIVVGQDLEIIPELNPALLGPGQLLPVRVLWQGKPLAGIEVTAASKKGESVAATLQRTDANGRAEVIVDRVGFWMVRVVHMQRCIDCGDADWESTWASLTFTSLTPPAPTTTPEAPPSAPKRDDDEWTSEWFWIWLVCMSSGVILGYVRWRRRT